MAYIPLTTALIENKIRQALIQETLVAIGENPRRYVKRLADLWTPGQQSYFHPFWDRAITGVDRLFNIEPAKDFSNSNVIFHHYTKKKDGRPIFYAAMLRMSCRVGYVRVPKIIWTEPSFNHSQGTKKELKGLYFLVEDDMTFTPINGEFFQNGPDKRNIKRYPKDTFMQVVDLQPVDEISFVFRINPTTKSPRQAKKAEFEFIDVIPGAMDDIYDARTTDLKPGDIITKQNFEKRHITTFNGLLGE